MYVIFGAVVASVGGVLFGYDIGITSGALLQLRDDFNLTSFEQELVVSSVLVGALCASFFGDPFMTLNTGYCFLSITNHLLQNPSYEYQLRDALRSTADETLT
ncbi:solute carrier family 2, facilitated glucose transporter member 12 [Trichonephila clavata]|uniref:Solute carrier family 2, facilitated glucose transporter member 12 n=1 Tax=Trichonephila clavata TaxID=2740835 RepID=A0A8X6I4B5_TRICU|nr:solute carrier family 2, facilitated glucose transporter member 12 [Trichonephila clavata]